MAKTLDRNVVLIDDDTEAKAYLAYHGMLEQLEPEHGCPRKFCFWRTEGSISVAAHFTGYTHPADNGYTIVILPTEGFTEDELVNLMRAFVENGRDKTGPCFSEWRTVNEEAN